MAGLARRALLLGALTLLAGCYSLLEQRVATSISCGEEPGIVVEHWTSSYPQPEDFEGKELSAAVICALAYPFDVVAGLIMAPMVFVVDDVRIRGGLLGAAAGIALPYLTLFAMPHLGQSTQVEMSSTEYRVLRRALGDELRADLVFEFLAPALLAAGPSIDAQEVVDVRLGDLARP